VKPFALKNLVLAGAFAACAFAAAPVAAADLPDGGMTVNEVASWLKSSGYTADVAPDTTQPGFQIVKSHSDGINWDIYFYSCESGRCAHIEYVVGWSDPNFSSAKITDWNHNHQFIRAYLDDKGEPFGEFDVDIAPGGTYAMLDQSLKRWRQKLVEFKGLLYP
jgi:hypothetical protein